MDGIIFDVDGTLWDSTEQVAASYNIAINRHTNHQVHVTGDDLKKLFGKTMTEIFAVILPGYPASELPALLEQIYTQQHNDLRKIPGVCYEKLEETLCALSKKYPLFIVSNCQCGYIEVFLEVTGLGKYFQDTLCFGQTQTSKGQTILRLMEKNHLTSPIYVGDTLGDQEACKEAKIPFVFAEYGFGEAKDPAYRIQKFSDLTELF